jgi:putative ABC transport system substrate-binding protein
VIGVLSSASYGSYSNAEDAFLKGLKEAGFIEGNGISIEWCWAQGRYDNLPSLANEILSRGLTVIVCFDAPAAFAAKAATIAVPIVFATGADPIETGLVDSFRRPSGNLTGVTTLISALLSKQFEFLGELLTAKHNIAFLANVNNPNIQSYAPEVKLASEAIGRPVQMLTVRTEVDIDAALTTIHHQVDALVVAADPLFIARREQIVSLAARYALPTIYPSRVFCEVGGLISYGSAFVPSYRQVGNYTGRILKGAKPVDLPIQQSTQLELVINLKTAKALGLTIPSSLVARADEVIE